MNYKNILKCFQYLLCIENSFALEINKDFHVVVFSDPSLMPFPQPFATALFSFLYHLASYENGMLSAGFMCFIDFICLLDSLKN